MGPPSKPNSFSSEKFLSQLKNRETTAITKLVQAYTEQLYRAALGMGLDEPTSRELTQNVWTTFFDVVPNFKAQSHVRTFLFGILYNKASELRRLQKRFVESDDIEDIIDRRFAENGEWLRPPVNPEKFLQTSQTLEIIEECLEALPLSQRTAFYLKQVEEENTSHICKILEVTRTNLGVLLHRAKHHLRECIEGKTKDENQGC